MLDWLTVLELTAAAVVVIGVLSVTAHFVNQARAKASAAGGGKTRTVAQPPVSAPEPHSAIRPAAVAPAAVVTPPAADATPSSESFLPPLEPIPLVSDAPPPAVEPSPTASKIVPVRFPRFAKPRAIPVARLNRFKATRLSKIKRRTRSAAANGGRRMSFAPVTKAKPPLTRRPKRVIQVRRKKITVPVRRSGKAVAHRSPRPVLTPA
jgi:hypothetical protein